MFAIAGLAITYSIDPNLISILKPVFDFMATAIPSGLSEFSKAIGLDLSIEVSSTISDVIMVIVAALTPVVVFDFGRRVAAALFPTEPEDEQAKDYDLPTIRIIGDGVENEPRKKEQDPAFRKPVGQEQDNSKDRNAETVESDSDEHLSFTGDS